jgi:DNA-binding XRE family transcriptional regulator
MVHPVHYVGNMARRTGLHLLEEIASVEPREGYVLGLTWTDGLRGEVCVRPLAERFPAYALLLDPARFATARPGPEKFTVDFGQDLEIPADLLRRKALEQLGRVMPVEDFRAWRERNGLSLARAAEALGLTRRTIIYYESGRRLIPRTVMLACRGWEAMRSAA